MDKKDIKVFESLSDEVRKLNSYKRRFLMGLIMGLGSALGATVVGSLVLAVLYQLSKEVGIDGAVEGMLGQ